MPCPLSMVAVTVIRAVARPAVTPSTVMPSARDAASSAYIAAAQARARASASASVPGSISIRTTVIALGHHERMHAIILDFYGTLTDPDVEAARRDGFVATATALG